jgi:hypothetical protein
MPFRDVGDRDKDSVHTSHKDLLFVFSQVVIRFYDETSNDRMYNDRTYNDKTYNDSSYNDKRYNDKTSKETKRKRTKCLKRQKV